MTVVKPFEEIQLYFYNSIKPVVILAGLFGVIPIASAHKSSPKRLKFSWCQWINFSTSPKEFNVVRKNGEQFVKTILPWPILCKFTRLSLSLQCWISVCHWHYPYPYCRPRSSSILETTFTTVSFLLLVGRTAGVTWTASRIYDAVVNQWQVDVFVALPPPWPWHHYWFFKKHYDVVKIKICNPPHRPSTSGL